VARHCKQSIELSAHLSDSSDVGIDGADLLDDVVGTVFHILISFDEAGSASCCAARWLRSVETM
jgi:hypothetical protein